MDGLKIYGTGSALPELSIDNGRFSEIADTSDEWITTRTGIKSRRFVTDETNLSLTAKASKRAVEASGINISDIGFVISATCTNDRIVPALSCMLQRELGLSEAVMAFDINAACSGFVYAVITAANVLKGRPEKYALITGSEVLSRVTDFSDRSTCVLFGDGAGAVVLGLSGGIFSYTYGTLGNEEILNIPSGFVSENPFAPGNISKDKPYLRMDGQEVYRFAAEYFPKSVLEITDKYGLKPDDVDWYVCHQANLRILQACAKRLNQDLSKFFTNISRYGNTSAASTAIALDELSKSGKLRRGDKVILGAFGGGLTYGTILIEW